MNDAEAPTRQYACALSTCTWTHTPPPLPALDGSLTDEQVHAELSAQSSQIEAELRAHAATHGGDEWLREVIQLRQALGQQPPILHCTMCITALRIAERDGKPLPPVYPVTALANGIGICNVPGIHEITAPPPGAGTGLLVPSHAAPGGTPVPSPFGN